MGATTTQQVRQVLMNELGLTRESVRNEMVEVCAGVAEKFFARLLSDDKLEQVLIEAATAVLRREANTPRWQSFPTFQELVKEAARSAATKFVSDHLRISTTEEV